MRSEPYFHLLGLPMGPPQFVAGLLLLCFLAQCGWLLVVLPNATAAHLELYSGPPRRQGSPVVNWLASSGLRLAHAVGVPLNLLDLLRLFLVAIAAFVGASIWYVARRLYGNAGGIAALLLYCFSPMTFVAVSVSPMPVAALGMFGVVFIAIAVSHTLYAPPRENLWGEIRHRWRRVAMLGLAIALMTGSAPELSFMVVVALGFMLYLVPHRRWDALGLMVAAVVIAVAILLAVAGPRWFTFARFSPFAGWSGPHYVVHTAVFAAGWTIVAAALAALTVYVACRRSRYFGNSAPLIATVLTLVLAHPTLGEAYIGPFPAWSLPLLFVFVGGIFADLVETEWRGPAIAVFSVLAGSLAVLELLAVVRHQSFRPF